MASINSLWFTPFSGLVCGSARPRMALMKLSSGVSALPVIGGDFTLPPPPWPRPPPKTFIQMPPPPSPSTPPFSNLKDLPGLVDETRQPVRLRGVGDHRLFHQHVTARFERLHAMLEVQRVRRHDDHGIRLGFPVHLGRVGVDGRLRLIVRQIAVDKGLDV